MQVRNTSLFEQAMEEILSCGHNYYSKKTIQNFYTQYKNYRQLLEINPLLGQREETLEGFILEYRKITIKPYFKIIYTIYEDTVYLADVWDTRRSPEILRQRLD